MLYFYLQLIISILATFTVRILITFFIKNTIRLKKNLNKRVNLITSWKEWIKNRIAHSVKEEIKVSSIFFTKIGFCHFNHVQTRSVPSETQTNSLSKPGVSNTRPARCVCVARDIIKKITQIIVETTVFCSIKALLASYCSPRALFC